MAVESSWAGFGGEAAKGLSGLGESVHAAGAFGRGQAELFDQESQIDAEALGGLDLAA
jgi:hypothetical protein